MSTHATYVFKRANGTWSQQAKLVPEDGDAGDLFGSDVALAGDTALVCAWWDTDPNGTRAGAAYLFERANGTWRQRTKLTPEDGDAGDDFGVAVALADDTLLVGADGDEQPNGEEAGSAYVFGLEAVDTGGVVGRYDEDGSGTIDNRELLDALADYPDTVSDTDLLELLSAYEE